MTSKADSNNFSKIGNLANDNLAVHIGDVRMQLRTYNIFLKQTPERFRNIPLFDTRSSSETFSRPLDEPRSTD